MIHQITIHDFINTYDGCQAVLEAIAGALEQGKIDENLTEAIDYLYKAEMILREYEGEIKE